MVLFARHRLPERRGYVPVWNVIAAPRRAALEGSVKYCTGGISQVLYWRDQSSTVLEGSVKYCTGGTSQILYYWRDQSSTVLEGSVRYYTGGISQVLYWRDQSSTVLEGSIKYCTGGISGEGGGQVDETERHARSYHADMSASRVTSRLAQERCPMDERGTGRRARSWEASGGLGGDFLPTVA
eukprot:gene9609-biopygen6447